MSPNARCPIPGWHRPAPLVGAAQFDNGLKLLPATMRFICERTQSLSHSIIAWLFLLVLIVVKPRLKSLLCANFVPNEYNRQDNKE